MSSSIMAVLTNTNWGDRLILRSFVLWTAIIGGSFMLYHVFLPIRFAHHLITAAFLGWALWRFGLPNTPMLLPVLGMALTVIVASLNAIDPRMAWENASVWGVNLLLFLVMIELCRRGMFSRLLRWHVWAGGALAVSMIAEWMLTGGRASGIFFNINLAGAFLAALLLPAILSNRTLLASLMGIAIVLNGGRGPILCFFVGVFVWLWLTKEWRWLAIPLAIAGAMMVLAISLNTDHSSGDAVRLDLWQAAYQMMDERVTGVGPGLFAQEYVRLGQSGEFRFTGAHNHYLTTAAELGIPGLFMAFALGLCVLLGAKVGEGLSPRQKVILATLVGIMAQMLFDNYPSQNWALLVSLYAAYLCYRWRFPPLPKMERRAVAGLSVGLALALGAWLYSDYAQVRYEAGLRGDTAAAQQAAQLDPSMRLYRVPYLRSLRIRMPDEAVRLAYTLTSYGRISK